MSLIDSDRSVGSGTRELAEAVARELAALWEQLEALYESAFVETADQLGAVCESHVRRHRSPASALADRKDD